MFASFKRSPASTHASATTATATGTGSTEKDSSADYADLEKRADGRWSVQNRPGTLRVHADPDTGTDTDTDGKATKRTCSGFLPAQVGVLFFTTFTLIISGVFIGMAGMNIARNGEPLREARVANWADDSYSAGSSMRHVDLLVAATSLSLWAFLFITCVLGLVRCRCCCLPPQPWAGPM
jgi:hypothetical protein